MTARMTRSMWPKTLGVWVELAAPLVTALALARPTVTAVLFAVSAIALFLAREPAEFALGYRGEEIRREEGWRARNWIRICLIVGLVALGIAFFLGDQRVKFSVGGPLVLWILLGIITVRHEDKTFNGELIADAAISGAGFPIATAEGISLRISIDVWLAWVAGFFAATIAMRSILEKGDRKSLQQRAIVWLAVLTGVGLLAWYSRLSLGFIPAIPIVLVAWVIAVLRPKKKKREAANALAVAAIVTGAILIYLTRAPG